MSQPHTWISAQRCGTWTTSFCYDWGPVCMAIVLGLDSWAAHGHWSNIPRGLYLWKFIITDNVSWLLSHSANWRIVFLSSGFHLGLWPTHMHRLNRFWTESHFLTLVHGSHSHWCVGSDLLLFSGCSSRACNCYSSSSYNCVFLVQLTSGGRPHYYVSYRRNAFAQMKLPKYALPKVWPELFFILVFPLIPIVLPPPSFPSIFPSLIVMYLFSSTISVSQVHLASLFFFCQS